MRRALEEGLTAAEACDRWYSGAFLLETVPSALFVLAQYSHDPEEAIVRAVKDTSGSAVRALLKLGPMRFHYRNGIPTPTLPRERGVGQCPRPFATRSHHFNDYGHVGPGHNGQVLFATF